MPVEGQWSGAEPGLVRRAFWLVNAGNLRQALCRIKTVFAQAGVNQLDLIRCSPGWMPGMSLPPRI